MGCFCPKWGSTGTVFVVLTLLGLTQWLPTAQSLRCGKALSYDHSEFFSCPRPFDRPDAVYCCNPGTKDSYCCSMPNQDLNRIGRGDHSKSSSSHSVLSSSETNSNNEQQHIVYVESQANNEVQRGPGIPPLDDSKAEKRSIVGGLAKLVGIIIGVAIAVVIICVLCCCCCPFCILAKKRSRGEVIRTNEEAAGTSHQLQVNQQYPPNQPNASYPPNQQELMSGYPPSQQQGYSQGQQQGYPQGQQQGSPQGQQQGYPQGQHQAPQGYPNQPFAGYPSHPGAYAPQSSYPGYSTGQPAGAAYPPQMGGGWPVAFPAQPPPYSGMETSHSQPRMASEAYQTQPSFNPNY